MLELTDSRQAWLIETAQALKGYERRRFMARTVRELGAGGQSLAERELGWNRQTLRKALLELERGIHCLDAFALRRRKCAEDHLPALLDDIKALVDAQSQTDPAFRTNRLYTRFTAAEVRRQLIAQKGYTNEQLPTERTIATKLRALG
jgi:hypothetical protein